MSKRLPRLFDFISGLEDGAFDVGVDVGAMLGSGVGSGNGFLLGTSVV